MSCLPLQKLISTVDASRLPILLKVCSGIYFQGSVYELSGSEVCFSTGDLVKIIGMELVSVTCEDTTTHLKSDLPLNHKGLFKQVPGGKQYQTLKEMLSGRVLGTGESPLPFSFYSKCELTLDNLSVGPGTLMTALSVDPGGSGGEGTTRCQMSGTQGGSIVVVLPLCCQGEFYQCFSLQDIVSSAQLCSQHFCRIGAADGAKRPLSLCPVYNVEGHMHMRKNTLRFPSSLDMDVEDVTNQDHKPFITPYCLDELLTLPDHTFPIMAQILETPKVEHLVCSGWVKELLRDQQLVLHSKGSVTMALFSSPQKTKQYFLVSEHYGGRFRRKPREFRSVFEMYVAATQAPGLRVTVAGPSQETEEDVNDGLPMGEVLEVVGFQSGGKEVKQLNPNQIADALICRCIEELSDGEEEIEKVSALSPSTSSATLVLSLNWYGFFREVMVNNKKYRIKDLCQQCSLPLDVKVASRDSNLASDPLYGYSLRLEGVMVETIIQASFPSTPELCFTIPTRWLSMVIYFTEHSLPWPKGEPLLGQVDAVTKVRESFYLENCKLIYSQQAPPPRPPKNNLSLARKSMQKPFKPEPLADCNPALSANSSIQEKELSKPSIACKAKESIDRPQVTLSP
ncbi:Protein THEMIS2 [Merluccius polli]|uniref:Protein THEMIS2 n=1 Tax=Merluccius polli TaxID=89951 RepID=A0AA47P8L4_MERPO|nr:Protein THEMIS2 [Merluccius polli]